MTVVERHPTIQARPSRMGLTLIEIMIALTMTLIVLGAMMQAFQFASVEMSKGRAMMEASNQLRAAEDTLRRDLNGITVDLRPYTQSTIPSGYFEYLEGPRHDNESSKTPNDPLTREDENALSIALYGYLGDVDDILAMTVRSEDRPFRGRFNGQIIESSVAEVIWFTRHKDRNSDGIIDFDEPVELYRRVLLIRPDLEDLGSINIDFIYGDKFFAENDVSARSEGGRLIANSLADLANRANRFCHEARTFPHFLKRVNDLETPGLENTRVSDPELMFDAYTGDDIMLTNICAFDVKVFSSNAAVQIISGAKRLREQSDVGFEENIRIDQQTQFGGFMDLGSLTGNRGTQGDFSEQPATKSQLGGNTDAPRHPPAAYFVADSVQVYDTWTPQYEYDGIDQDGDGIDDQGTNDFDNDGQNGVDDNGERETMPPYPKPIRGLKVTLRVIEKNSKQVRQSSVVKSAVPQ